MDRAITEKARYEYGVAHSSGLFAGKATLRVSDRFDMEIPFNG